MDYFNDIKPEFVNITEHRNIMRMILFYGKIRYSQEIEIKKNSPKVLVENVQIITDEYKKQKLISKQITIKTEDIICI